MRLKFLLSIGVAMLSLCAFAQLSGPKIANPNPKFPGWFTDLEAAKEEAVKQNAGKTNANDLKKYIYLCVFVDNQQGQPVRSELFSKQRFQKFAKDNFILVALDVTLRHDASAADKERILGLLKQYGFPEDASKYAPKIFILNDQGGRIQPMDFKPKTAEGDYLIDIKEFLTRKGYPLNEDALKGYKDTRTPLTPTTRR